MTTLVEMARQHSWEPRGRKVRRRGLGDIVARCLAVVGITKRRARLVAALFGAKDCGCGRRQKAMNAWGERIRRLFV